MGESNLGQTPGKEETEEEIEAEVATAAEANAIKDGSNAQKPVHRKEPSFSRWFDEDGITPSNSSMDFETSTAEESEDFELPLFHGGGSGDTAPGPDLQEREAPLRRTAYVGLNGDRVKYTPLGIESGIRTGNSRMDVETLEHKPQSSISAVNVIKTLILILVWYTFSTCLTLYNKLLLGDHLGKFPAPLLMNTVHFGMQAILSNAIVYFQSRGSENSSAKMKWRDYFVRVVPTALGTALEINLSNVSLVFISVTFATMCKSAAPIFLLLFAFAFGLEKPSIKLLSIMLIISTGVLLTVAKETEFEFWGFLFVMLAAVMSGFRWCMTQILLQKETYGLNNPITLMSYVTPVMSLVTAVLSLFMDPWQDFWKNVYFDNSRHVTRSCLILLLGGSLAFFMVLTEYVLVSVTSAVTVTIAGIIKEAVTILVAVVYFHDQFTWLKGIGLVIIIFGVSLFNFYKYQKLKNSEQIEHAGTNSASSDGTTKYVILDDMDFQDDAP